MTPRHIRLCQQALRYTFFENPRRPVSRLTIFRYPPITGALRAAVGYAECSSYADYAMSMFTSISARLLRALSAHYSATPVYAAAEVASCC